jgi:hypothetical protein
MSQENRLRFLLLISGMVCFGWAKVVNAKQLCVSDYSQRCYRTIQSAIDVAKPGDTIKISPKKSGEAYNESVVIRTERLKIIGERPLKQTYFPLRRMFTFSGIPAQLSNLRTDKMVQKWMYSQGSYKGFTQTLSELERLSNTPFFSSCPDTIVETCNIIEEGNKTCGYNGDNESPVFFVDASHVTISNLTFRHGDSGIRLAQNSTHTQISENCFRRNHRAVESEEVDEDFDNDEQPITNHYTNINNNFIDNASNFEGFEVHGNHVTITSNLLINTEGIAIKGKNYTVKNNALSVTTDDECIDVTGGEGVIAYNVGIACDGGLELDEGSYTKIIGNFFIAIPDDDDGLDVKTSIDNDSNDMGNRFIDIKYNILSDISDDGIDFYGANSTIEGNLIQQTSNDSSEAGIRVRGSNNIVENNLVRNNSNSGIRIEANDSDDGDVFVTDGNLIKGNHIYNNHSAGILIDNIDINNNGSDEDVLTNTTIDENIIMYNDGEGIAISRGAPENNDNIAASNTLLINNTVKDNRTDICNESDTTVIALTNQFSTGGINTDCVVE